MGLLSEDRDHKFRFPECGLRDAERPWMISEGRYEQDGGDSVESGICDRGPLKEHNKNIY